MAAFLAVAGLRQRRGASEQGSLDPHRLWSPTIHAARYDASASPRHQRLQPACSSSLLSTDGPARTSSITLGSVVGMASATTQHIVHWLMSGA